jgi:hypothetical protein
MQPGSHARIAVAVADESPVTPQIAHGGADIPTSLTAAGDTSLIYFAPILAESVYLNGNEIESAAGGLALRGQRRAV